MQPEPSTDSTTVILFDGVCNLCDATVRFIAANDPRGRFRFASLQSAAAARLLARHGREPASGTPGSIIVIDAIGIHERSRAALTIAGGLRWPWRWLTVLTVVPAGLLDPLYDLVARNRYRWFGRRDVCALPSADLARRFLSE